MNDHDECASEYKEYMSRMEAEVRAEVANSDAKSQTAYEYVARAQWALSELAVQMNELARMPDEAGVGEGDRRMWRDEACHAMSKAQAISGLWGSGGEL